MTPAETDWEAIELAHRAGVLSVREIAKQHGITHGAVQKRAKAVGWSRDLSAKVRKAVATQLVATEVATVSPATERVAVEAGAATLVSLVREHRRDIAGQRGLAETLKGQLEEAIGCNRPVADDDCPRKQTFADLCIRPSSDERRRDDTQMISPPPTVRRLASARRHSSMSRAFVGYANDGDRVAADVELTLRRRDDVGVYIHDVRSGSCAWQRRSSVRDRLPTGRRWPYRAQRRATPTGTSCPTLWSAAVGEYAGGT